LVPLGVEEGGGHSPRSKGMTLFITSVYIAGFYQRGGFPVLKYMGGVRRDYSQRRFSK
jgi:hypothetical protein